MEWRYTADIKQHFTELDSPDSGQFTRCRDAVAGELMKSRDYPADAVLQAIVRELSEATGMDEFNLRLNDLYDWADDRRAWLGL